MAGTGVRRGAAGRPGRARPAGDDRADEAERRAGRARSRSRSTTADQLGRPVAAEVSLALVDRSLLRLFGDRLPPIGPFFYDQTRTGAFATESTNTFRYAARDACRCPRRSSRRRRSRRRSSPTRPSRDAAKRGGRGPGRRRCAGAPQAPPAAGRRPASQAAWEGRMARQDRMRRQLVRGRRCRGMAPMERRPRRESRARRARSGSATDDVDREGSCDWQGRGRPPTRGRNSAVTRSLGRRRGDELGTSRAAPRERFVETAYWNPSVVTGKDGKARVTFTRPGGPLRVPVHRAGRHRRRHPRRPDDGRPRRPQGLLRRPEGPRRR